MTCGPPLVAGTDRSVKVGCETPRVTTVRAPAPPTPGRSSAVPAKRRTVKFTRYRPLCTSRVREVGCKPITINHRYKFQTCYTNRWALGPSQPTGGARSTTPTGGSEFTKPNGGFGASCRQQAH